MLAPKFRESHFCSVVNSFEPRRLVNATAALVGHCSADTRSQSDCESYLSLFRFSDDFKNYLTVNSTTKGFTGSCWSTWLWIDIDRSNLDIALADTRRFVGYTLFRFTSFNDDDLLYFFSGSKGFHVGIPLPHNPEPSPDFPLICKTFASRISAEVGVPIDESIYERVRLFRSPNSRHPKTKYHKRRFTYAKLNNLTAERMKELAQSPNSFEVNESISPDETLTSDWLEAESKAQEQQAKRVTGKSTVFQKLQRATLDFIREGAEVGERSTRLFRAAGNLREYGASPELIGALLTESALDSGLAPKEIERVIKSGIENSDRHFQGGAA